MKALQSILINSTILLTPDILQLCEDFFQTQTWVHKLSEERQLGVFLQPAILAYLQVIYPELGFKMVDESKHTDYASGDFEDQFGNKYDVKIGIDSKYDAASVTQYPEGTVQFANQKLLAGYFFARFTKASEELILMAYVERDEFQEVRGDLRSGVTRPYYMVTEERLHSFFKWRTPN